MQAWYQKLSSHAYSNMNTKTKKMSTIDTPNFVVTRSSLSSIDTNNPKKLKYSSIEKQQPHLFIVEANIQPYQGSLIS